MILTGVCPTHRYLSLRLSKMCAHALTFWVVRTRAASRGDAKPLSYDNRKEKEPLH